MTSYHFNIMNKLCLLLLSILLRGLGLKPDENAYVFLHCRSLGMHVRLISDDLCSLLLLI